MGTNVNRTFPILWLEGLLGGGILLYNSWNPLVKTVLEHILGREATARADQEIKLSIIY